MPHVPPEPAPGTLTQAEIAQANGLENQINARLANGRMTWYLVKNTSDRVQGEVLRRYRVGGIWQVTVVADVKAGGSYWKFFPVGLP